MPCACSSTYDDDFAESPNPALRFISSASPQRGPIMSMRSWPSQTECGEGGPDRLRIRMEALELQQAAAGFRQRGGGMPRHPPFDQRRQRTRKAQPAILAHADLPAQPA